MPAGPRVRGNNAYGTTTDNPLTAGALTFNSAALPRLPTVSAAHAVVVLDPKRVNGEPEIVVVTTHAALATVATITRGQYGTMARSHPSGTAWAHVPIDEDFIEVLTSATRPSNPYEGQGIYETDTNKLVFYTGTDWAPRDAGGTLGIAQAAAANQTFTTPAVLVTGVTTAVTTATARRIKVTAHLNWAPNAIGDQIDVTILQDGVVQKLTQDTGETAGRAYPISFYCILTPTAGAHTYELFVERAVGAGNLTIINTSNRQALILVEDIGAA